MPPAGQRGTTNILAPGASIALVFAFFSTLASGQASYPDRTVRMIVTQDREGNVRPYWPRQLGSLSEAKEENGQSRIYLGIRWAFDKREGIAQGRRVADHVFDHAFQPVR